jgi:hypothetical protein
MLLVPARRLRCKTSRSNRSEDTVCTQTCKHRPGMKTGCPVYEQTGRQLSYYSAAAIFRWRARLTAPSEARNLIRIRTKWQTAKDPINAAA